jgi:hypothetical protein
MHTITRIAKWAVVGLMMLLAMNVITGIAFARPQRSSVWVECHHWCGHLMVLGSWLAFAVSLATFIAGGAIEGRWRLGLLGAIIGFFTLLLILHTSFTGYLGPSHMPDVGPETRMRFQAIHILLEPTLLIVVLAWWLSLLRRLGRIHA